MSDVWCSRKLIQSFKEPGIYYNKQLSCLVQKSKWGFFLLQYCTLVYFLTKRYPVS